MAEMNPLAIVVLALAAACTQGGPRQEPVGLPLKAPIEIDGVPGARSMDVVLTFSKDASDVEVEVVGLDGLAVTTDRRPILKASYRAGQKVPLHVEYLPGPGQSLLGITVVASYGTGSRLAASRVYEFGK